MECDGKEINRYGEGSGLQYEVLVNRKWGLSSEAR